MSDRVMMALGDFRFETARASYQTLAFSQSWRWPEQARIGREPAHQFTGREKTEIKLSGTLYPSFGGGLADLRALRALADTGDPHLLVDGLGRVWGSWIILSVNDNRSILVDDGRPRKIGFDMTLRDYGEDDTLDVSGWNPLSAAISIAIDALAPSWRI